MSTRGRLRRLLAPHRIAYVGGDAAAIAIRECRRLGFRGEIWPVHPTRDSIEGIACFPDVDALPDAPDAALVSVPAATTVEVVAALAARGCGGAVCHASGFAEIGPAGQRLQAALVRAAGPMPVLGPNCLGLINYLDRVGMWPDRHGGRPVRRGIALVTQSGSIGQNLTMHRRLLPISHLVTVGNSAVTGVPAIVEALLEDDRVSAIGLYLEGIADAPALAACGIEALRRQVPIVVWKSGSSELAARANLGHTAALSGSDELADALFERVGMARVDSAQSFLETLKFLHMHGCPPGERIASASCSGGEAALVADAAERADLTMPPFPPSVRDRLSDVLVERVPVANPLDYHTYIWGDPARQTACFEAFLAARFDTQLLVLDVPRGPGGDTDWRATAAAFVAAHDRQPTRCCVVSTLPEGMPEPIGRELLDAGIAPMQGIESCIEAIGHAVRIGRAQRGVDKILPLPPTDVALAEPGPSLAEHDGKQILAGQGIPVPSGVVADAAGAGAAAHVIGFPVAVKIADGVTHKSDVGGVWLGLNDPAQVAAAVASMRERSDSFLVERMVDDAVAELIVGVQRDPQYGLALTLGAGGILTELLRDAATLLLPATRTQVAAALRELRCWPLLTGFRGRPPGDVAAVLDTVDAVMRYARTGRPQVLELDINPLLVRPEGLGVVAADVVLRYADGPKRREEPADDRRGAHERV